MKVLVTGAAGFIGSKIAGMLAERGDEVVGIDNINDYYDIRLKLGRLAEYGIDERALTWHNPVQSTRWPGLRFIRMGIEDKPRLDRLFETERFDRVVNLAAQAGVRYSIENPYAYLTSNITGFLNLLECCRHHPVSHLLFASSSSVYGLNTKAPFSETDMTDQPVSLYAASKKSNELMAHSYSKLYGIPATGLRFFTVYGPWGRPDMAPMLFARSIMEGKPIQVFNHGDMIRDFTYIDDIANGSVLCLDQPPVAECCPNGVAFRVYNIGCSHPVRLMEFISELEQVIGCEAVKVMRPMQAGDVYMTNADTTRLETEIGYKPHVTLHEGINKFAQWYKSEKNPLRP